MRGTAAERVAWGKVVQRLLVYRRDEAELAVQSAEVEPVECTGDGDLEVVDAPPGAAVADEFDLEQLSSLGPRSRS
jgi:hypothetical protein